MLQATLRFLPEREGVIGRTREDVWLTTLAALARSLPQR